MRNFKVSVPRYDGNNLMVLVEAETAFCEDEVLYFRVKNTKGNFEVVAAFSKWDYYVEVTDE